MSSHSKTPPHLQSLGMPENCGPDRDVPRAFLACKLGPQFKSLYVSMVMSKALPEYGQKAAQRNSVTHAELAGMNGVRRETVTRWFGKFANSRRRRKWDGKRKSKGSFCFWPREGNDAAVNNVRAERVYPSGSTRGMVDQGKGSSTIPGVEAGHHSQPQLKPGSKKAVRCFAAIAPVFNVSCRVNAPNLYTGPRGRTGDKGTATAEALAEQFGHDVFEARAWVNGYKGIYSWLWHETFPAAFECECRSGQLNLFRCSSCSSRANAEHEICPDPKCHCTECHPERCPKCEGRGWHLRRQQCPCVEKGRADARCSRCGGSGQCVEGMPDLGRLIASYYLLMSIEDEVSEIRDQNGRIVRYHQPAGVFQQSQEKTCRDLGIDPETLTKYNRMLARLTVTKITPGANYDEDGVEIKPGDKSRPIVSSDPDKIHWMPTRLLDRELCVQEFARLRAAMQHVLAIGYDKLALDIYAALLSEWQGKEHSLKALWNEGRRRFAARGIPKSVQNALLPFKPG